MIPLQDTPSVKQYFSALVLVKDPRIKVYMTGNLLQGTPFKRMTQYSEKLTEYHFSLNIKIPSYLIAIVAGNLEQRKVGN
jgi:leukotriene-A4 hydrolase